MEDIYMDKNKKIKVANIFLEADEKQYKEIKGDYNHTYYLRTQKEESEIEVVSLDAIRESEYAGRETIADSNVNVSEEVEKIILIEMMNSAREKLNKEDQQLITLYYDEEKTQVEIEEITGIPQSTVSYRLERACERMRKIMGVKKFSKK